MRKIIKISLILLAIIFMATNVYAVSCAMALQTAKNEYNKNDVFVVDVAISSMDVPDGIIALGATLEYDKNSLSLEKMEGQNSWSNPTYNEANGKLIMDRGSLGNKPETILKLTFKVKEQSASETTITVKDITASGGETTGDIPIANFSKKITVKSGAVDPTPTPPDTNTTPPTNTANTTPNTNTSTNTTPNTNTNKNTTTNTNTQNTSTNQTPTPPSTTTNSSGSQGIVANTSNESTRDTKKTGVLPKTGTTRKILIVLIGTAVVAVIFYVKIKILDVNVK